MNRIPGRDFSALFDPRSVAVIGASNDHSKYGNWLSAQALRMKDLRSVHLVNRRAEPVLGYSTVAALSDVPTTVDLVVITVPANGFEDAVDDALAAGAKAIVGVTAGFAELGEDGRTTQNRIVERVRDAGAMLLGPNCLGVSDSTTALTLASNPLPAGRVSLLSQSGNMALELAGFFGRRDLGFARFVSLGNQADVTVADFIDACAEHDGTDLIAVYCEDFGDGRAVVAAAAHARRRGKPVVLLTVGGSEASVRGARSHTGALTTSSDVLDAACRHAGIYRVHTPRELADVAAMLLTCQPQTVSQVAVIADGGGHAGVASDVLESSGLTVPEFSAQIRQQLRAALPPSAGVSNPIDLAGAGEQDITSFAATLDTVLTGPEIDAVVVTGYFGGYGDYGDTLAQGEIDTAHRMVQLARRHHKPVLVHTMRPSSAAASVLTAGGIPVFEAIEDAARTLGALVDVPPPPASTPAPVGSTPVLTSDGYWDARELFRDAGVDFLPARLVHTRAEAVAASDAIGYPVVLKAMGILHKSDAGGVVLGLRAAQDVERAFDAMERSLAAPGYCVEAMADLDAGVELIVGVQTDPRFGPIAMVGIGGVFTEVLADVAFALAPIDSVAARQLLGRLRAAALLRGVRGRPPIDLDAAAEAIAAITSVAAEHPEIAELEVNPLLATPRGAVGLDARIILTNNLIDNPERTS